MKNLLQLSFYGLCLGLVVSQSLMDLFFVLTFFVLIFFLRMESKSTHIKEIFKSKIVIFSLIWFGYLIIDFILKSPEKTLVKTVMSQFVWIPLFPLFVILWSRLEMKLKWIQTVLVFLFIGSLFAVLVFIFGFDPLHQSWSDRTHNLAGFWRSGGFYSNPMALAQTYGPLLMMLTPLSLSSLFSKVKRTRLQFLLISTFVMTGFAVLFTFTRGVWIGFVISGVIGGFILNRKVGLMALLTTVLTTILLMISWPRFNERVLQVFDAKKSYDSERMVIWKTNWYIFQENPILGIGYGENKRRLREYYDLLKVPAGQFEGHAHNQYLHFLSGTGIIGLLFYLIWFGFFLKINYQIYHRYRELKQRDKQYLFLGIFLAQLTFHFGAMTESNFSIAKNRMLIVLIWSFLFYWSQLSYDNDYVDCNESVETF